MTSCVNAAAFVSPALTTPLQYKFRGRRHYSPKGNLDFVNLLIITKTMMFTLFQLELELLMFAL